MPIPYIIVLAPLYIGELNILKKRLNKCCIFADFIISYNQHLNKGIQMNTESLKIESTRIGLVNTINALVLTVLFTSIFFY